MTKRSPFEKLPEEALRELMPKLRPLLEEIYRRLGPGQAFIQFITDLNSEKVDVTLISPHPTVWISKEGLRVEVLLPNTSDSSPMGLTRWAAINDETVIYPTDHDSEKHYAKVDQRVSTEIVGPIHFKNSVTGIVLCDRIEGEVYQEYERGVFKAFLDRIDEEIRKNIEMFPSEDEVSDQLTSIISDCLKDTPTARGYIAVKRWDGLLEYFKVGDRTDLFLELAPHEGLCGKVLRTGEMVNETKLFSESNYISSDKAIRSEIVYPIKDANSATIGVINLESGKPNAYDDAAVVKLLEKKAKLAVHYARFYRTPTSPEIGLAIADLFQTSLWIRPPESKGELEETIRATLEQWLMRLFKAKRCEVWLRATAPKPSFLQDMSWEAAVKGSTTSAARNTLTAPVLLQGEPLFVMALELEGDREPQDQKTMRALCGIASESFRRARYEYRMRRFIHLTDRLITEGHSEAVIEYTVREIPDIVQSNHCTLFYLLQCNKSGLFVPGPSTAGEIHFRGHYPGYLPTVNHGLTGYVAESGKPLRIPDVRDDKALKAIDEKLVWKGMVSEQVEWDCRSFLACPIFDFSNPTRVIGVIRTHRDSANRRSGFSLEDDGMFKAISHLLSKPLSVFLQEKVHLDEYKTVVPLHQ